jgi:hypothetical protein
MLRNPDFEGGTTKENIWWNGVLGPYRTTPGFAEVNPPEGWVAWWVEGIVDASGRLTGRPEVKVISLSTGADPERVLSGNCAVNWFTYWRTHYGGLLQVVEDAPPGEYEFGLYLHSWYSDCDGHPHREYPLMSDCVTRAEGSRDLLRVGIDPAGGMDPRADTVVWSQPMEVYGTYGEALTVRAHCQGRLTVFIWGESNYPLKHEDIYMDGAWLSPSQEGNDMLVWIEPGCVAAGQTFKVYALSQQALTNVKLNVDMPRSAVAWENTGTGWKYYWEVGPAVAGPHVALITADGGVEQSLSFHVARGLPREQYVRTYILLPPGAGSAWALAAVEATWDERRNTIGGSADDAGIGDLSDKRVIAVNPADWTGNASDLEQFFQLHYPGTQYAAVVAATPGELLQKLGGSDYPFELWQLDPRWRDRGFGAPSCLSTIGTHGCYITGLAIVLRKLGLDPHATPVTVDQQLGPEGYVGCRVLWDAAEAHLGLEIKGGTQADADAYLAAGMAVMAEVEPDTFEHFVVLDRRVGDDYLAHDPLRGDSVMVSQRYPGVESYRLVRPVTSPRVALSGLHDASGGQYMVSRGAMGYCLAHHVVQHSPIGIDHSAMANNGVQVLCRLNWGYADGTGTLPRPENKDSFVDAVVQTILEARGVYAFHVGNEPNNRQEWPGFGTSDEYALTPGYVAQVYNQIWERVQGQARLGPPPLDPYYGPGSNNREWWIDILNRMRGAHALFLHAKTQTNDPGEVWSEARFEHDPLRWQYLHMRVVETSLEVVPAAYSGLPVFITETNPQHKHQIGGELGWVADNREWVREVKRYIAHLNSRGLNIRAVIYYRMEADAWRLEDKGMILEEIFRSL